MPKLLEETVGAKFNVIAGYPGGSEVDLAVEGRSAMPLAQLRGILFTGAIFYLA